MNNHVAISVIVPVYNVERRLSKCIKSLIDQTFYNIEIILVNDGSTDGSLNICERYKNIDNRIKVICQKNQGLSKARNTGIEAAKGKLLMFVDSDDYVEKTFCSDAINNMRFYNSDMVVFGYTRVEAGVEKQDLMFGVKDRKLSKNEVVESLLSNSYAWNKLYKKSLFDDVKYPIGKNYEDLSTTYRLVARGNTFSYCAKANYNYVSSVNSIVGEMSPKNISDQFGAVLELTDFLKIKYPEIYIKNVDQLVKFAIRYCTYCDKNYNKKYHRRAYLILKKAYIPDSLDRLHKFVMVMYKFSAPLTEKALYLKRKYRNRRGNV